MTMVAVTDATVSTPTSVTLASHIEYGYGHVSLEDFDGVDIVSISFPFDDRGVTFRRAQALKVAFAMLASPLHESDTPIPCFGSWSVAHLPDGSVIVSRGGRLPFVHSCGAYLLMTRYVAERTALAIIEVAG
jgi:hypothetical protein